MNENNKELLEDVIEKSKNGKIIIMTSEGPMEAELDKITNQPADSLLYDLNRDLASLYTLAEQSNSLRWINDVAMANTVIYLYNKIDELKTRITELEKLNDSKSNEVNKSKVSDTSKRIGDTFVCDMNFL